MKRFTEFKPYRQGESKGRYVQYCVTGCYNDSDKKGDYTTGASVNRLAELEDKIEQGTLKEIPENAVVLSPEERDEEMREIRQAVIERMEATRKETAEKFAERLKEDKDIKLILTNVRYMQTPINEAEKAIMKKFDEICKELEGENGT